MKKTPLRRKAPMKKGKKPERVVKGTTTLERLLGEQKVVRASTLATKRKPTGERALFVGLYDKQEGKCAVTGEPLLPPSHPWFHRQGSHLLPKGHYPRARLWEDNVVMVLVGQHDLWEREKDKERLIEIEPRWRKYVNMYYGLRLAYNTKKR